MIVEELFATLGLKLDKGSWAKGDELLNAVKTSIIGIGAAYGLNKVREMVGGVVDLGSSLNDTAQRTGVAVEKLQYYGYVAKLNSGSAEQMAFAINFLSRNLAEAKNGTGEAADALKQLHISINDPAFKNADAAGKFELI